MDLLSLEVKSMAVEAYYKTREGRLVGLAEDKMMELSLMDQGKLQGSTDSLKRELGSLLTQFQGWTEYQWRELTLIREYIKEIQAS